MDKICNICNVSLAKKVRSLYLTIISSDLSAIIGHSCNCKIGNRVVGCCSHVATIIWYFAHARYLEAIPEPAGYLDNLFNIEEYCDDDDDVDD